MSIDIQTNIPLARYTTLKVGGPAEYFASVQTEEELTEAVAFAQERRLPLTVLGGGSNALVSDQGVKGLVVLMDIKGLRSQIEGGTIFVDAAAGENFDSVVAHTVTHGWWGLENLSHIPGTVGATPVQNVGAYGVEAKDVVHAVRAFNTDLGQFEMLDAAACAFGYRDSIFKHASGKRFIITAVTFALSLSPRRKLSYRDLSSWFADNPEPSQSEIREAVMKIRAGKFPDWHVVGTAGSFFKNPIIPFASASVLLERYPRLPVFAVNEHESKISLGWILDKVLHVRGYTKGNIALYKDQALVLVVNAPTTATEIEDFARAVTERIETETGIAVEWEVTKLQ